MAYLEELYYCSLCCGMCFLAGYDERCPASVSEGVCRNFDSKLIEAFCATMQIFTRLENGARVMAQPVFYAVREAYYMNTTTIGSTSVDELTTRLPLHQDVVMFMRQSGVLQTIYTVVDLADRATSQFYGLGLDVIRAILWHLITDADQPRRLDYLTEPSTHESFFDSTIRLLTTRPNDTDAGRWEHGFRLRCPALLAGVSPLSEESQLCVANKSALGCATDAQSLASLDADWLHLKRQAAAERLRQVPGQIIEAEAHGQSIELIVTAGNDARRDVETLAKTPYMNFTRGQTKANLVQELAEKNLTRPDAQVSPSYAEADV
jgi:hypothetical protein